MIDSTIKNMHAITDFVKKNFLHSKKFNIKVLFLLSESESLV